MGPEISDEIVAFDPETLARLPVRKRDVLEKFRGNRAASRVVASLPEIGGYLDSDAVDALLIRVHRELQRMSEEFEHGRRMAEILRPMIAALPKPVRVCDLGCGTGYVIRWLAKHVPLEGVELVGADYNAALIAEAARLASIENLRCRFVVANAFSLQEPASIVISTGVVHHFRGDALITLLRAHQAASIEAFAHVDFQPGPFAVPGAWLFHLARMRERLSLHDGVHSARRAHSASALLAAAKSGAPSFATGLYARRFLGPIPRVFHALVGIRPSHRDAWLAALGPRARRLEAFS